MPPPDPRKYLWDAASAAAQARDFAEGCSFEDYLSNAMLRAPVERQFEIIGEALNQLTKVDPELGLSHTGPTPDRGLPEHLDPWIRDGGRRAGLAGAPRAAARVAAGYAGSSYGWSRGDLNP